MSKESQQLTSLELKNASQKSRISEMEGSMNMAQENSAKIRKQALVYQEKISNLTNEVCYINNPLRSIWYLLVGFYHRGLL